MIKYGGNAMINEGLKRSVLENIFDLLSYGWKVIMVHGGGPFINQMLERMNIESEFVAGHRKTSKEAMRYIEMTLIGEVDTNLVAAANCLGLHAIGLSGKDDHMVTVRKKIHLEGDQEIDLGQVGEVVNIDPTLLHLLIQNGYLPILSCIASDDQGLSYNINADMMAGAVAAALQADVYCVLTDVDGLRRDKDRPETLIHRMSIQEIDTMIGTAIEGGMIPKIESCKVALDGGVKSVMIMNGTKPDTIGDRLINQRSLGTTIYKS